MSEYGDAINKGRLRRVRTPEGARFFRLPIGSIITPKAIASARARLGNDGGVKAALDMEDRAEAGLSPAHTAPQRAEVLRVGDRTAAAIGRQRKPDNAGDLAERIARARANARQARARTRRVSRNAVRPGE